MDYFVYILYSDKCDKYYVGQTDFLEKRIYEHNNSKGGKFSSTCAPWRLVYHEKYSSRNEAVTREREIKGRKSRRYIESLLSR